MPSTGARGQRIEEMGDAWNPRAWESLLSEER